jgi:cytochrome c556
MPRITPALFAGLIAGTAALAHEGVQNPAVKARMNAMSFIGQNMKLIAGMAKGEVDFEAEVANAALANIAGTAAEIPNLFEAEEEDPKSDAAPEIWLNWDDFTAKADALQIAAAETAISDPAGLGAAIGQLAPACKACHETYKF